METFVIRDFPKGDRACLGDSCYRWSLGRELEGIFGVLEQMVMWPWLPHGRVE